MSQKNDTIPLILALIITVGILAAGGLWIVGKTGLLSSSSTNSNEEEIENTQEAKSNIQTTFSEPQSVPQGTAIAINGSTSMVQINQVLKNSFQQRFPGAQVIINGEGTNEGINLLQEGNIDLAAISRPLTTQEEAVGLAAVPIVQDAIAIVVGVNNPFRRGLSNDRVIDIFTGNINNWSAVGGKNSTIQVINRPIISGTHQVFKQEVLRGANFGTGANFITLGRDATTPILKMLNTNGISYATYAQVANQQTVRTVAIDGLTPEASNYPYQRILYYAYQQPPSEKVKAFLGHTLSSQGQRAISGQ